jgi:hypothetical protein
MKCSHVPCNCKSEPGREYCSSECESDLRDEGATECHCGHQGCGASQSNDRDSTRT